METSTANILISDHIIKALCYTLMHSLWQGILLAAVGGAIVIFTKKTSAVYRYNLLIGALALFTCGIVITFLWQLCQSQINITTYIDHSLVSAPVNNMILIPSAVQQNTEGGLTETITTYFSAHYSAIVLIWFLIICAKSIQMAVGLRSVFHLKRIKVFPVSKFWQNRLTQLAEQLRVKQAISLMESGIAKVPMVIGHLKPVILIPIGLINSLSTGEVEAILIHELAHIRRRDYLVNLLQSFMEIVFFFNPAVLWISQLIKTERENCCDDLALEQSSDKVSYIQALVSCEEYKSVIPAHVMAFPGSKNTLLDRVKRMAGNRNHSLNMVEKTVLAICLVVSGLCVSAFTAREDIKKALKSVVAVVHNEVNAEPKDRVKAVKNDTTIKKQEAPINSTTALLNQFRHPAWYTIDTGKQASLSSLLTHKLDSLRGNDGTVNSQLAALAKLDTANFKKFHNIGLELYRERLVTDTNHLSISLNDRELIVNGVRMPEDVHERINRQFGTRGSYGGSYAQPYGNKYPGSYDAQLKEKSEQIAYELLKENLMNDKTYFTYKLSRDEFSIDGIKQPDELRRRIVDEFFKPDDDFNIGYTFKDPGIYGGPNSKYNKSSTDYQRQSEEQQRYWAGQQRKIIDEMAREGLIKYKNNVSFTLTNKTFVINGLVQNDDVFQRYRQEYVPAGAGDNWTWNYSGPGSYPTNAYRSRDWEAYNRLSSEERQRVQDETDKKLVADLMRDGLITNPNNVTFTLNDKAVTINGEKKSDAVYKKYKEKYMPATAGTGWSWTYSHHK